jgi:hypothetical protein
MQYLIRPLNGNRSQCLHTSGHKRSAITQWEEITGPWAAGLSVSASLISFKISALVIWLVDSKLLRFLSVIGEPSGDSLEVVWPNRGRHSPVWLYGEEALDTRK